MALSLSTLQTDIQNWAASSEATFVSSLPAIIDMAERAIYKRVKVPSARTYGTVSTVGGTATISVSVDYGLPIELYVTSNAVPLILRDPTYIREAYGYTGAAQGSPKEYAWLRSTVSASTILLGPTPDAIYALTYEYYTNQPESLITTTTGTWLSNAFPNVLRKWCFVEATIFQKAWEQLEAIKKEAEESLQAEMGPYLVAAKRDEFQG